MSLPYTADERHALEQALGHGRSDCPRCGGRVERHPVPQRPDVSYVRERVAVTCVACGATTVLDKRRIERAEEP
jgi:hypothetical protein